MRIAIKRKCRTRTKGWSIKDFRSLLKVPISISADIFVCYFCIYIYIYIHVTFILLCTFVSCLVSLLGYSTGTIPACN